MRCSSLALALAAATLVVGTTFDVCPGYNPFGMGLVLEPTRDILVTSLASCSSLQDAKMADAFYIAPIYGDFLSCFTVGTPSGPSGLIFDRVSLFSRNVTGVIRLVHTLRDYMGDMY